jgi:hypothetical protein
VTSVSRGQTEAGNQLFLVDAEELDAMTGVVIEHGPQWHPDAGLP